MVPFVPESVLAQCLDLGYLVSLQNFAYLLPHFPYLFVKCFQFLLTYLSHFCQEGFLLLLLLLLKKVGNARLGDSD